jgi:hypothetical protein
MVREVDGKKHSGASLSSSFGFALLPNTLRWRFVVAKQSLLLKRNCGALIPRRTPPIWLEGLEIYDR